MSDRASRGRSSPVHALLLLAFGIVLAGCAGRSSPFGRIDRHFFQESFDVDDLTIGRSGGSPAALRILVSPEASGPMGYIGKLADERLFASDAYPDFAFNVAFACAHVDFFGESAYADPHSPWFNVFFGYYEIDAPKSKWTRPFGYTSAGPGAQVDFRDVARIGVADWNYFSNHLYGVPAEKVHELDNIDFAALTNRYLGREQVGSTWWDHVTSSGVRVVTPFRSTVDHGEFVDSSCPNVGPLWRRAFGVHEPDASSPTSFFPVKMRAEILMSFDSACDPNFGEEVYRTFFFGATVADGFADPAERDRFLALQMEALRRVIAEKRRIGFPGPAAASDGRPC